MTFDNESLPSALRRLEKASTYRIIFTYDNSEKYRVTGSVKNLSFEATLKYILKDKPLIYTITGKLVYIQQSPDAASKTKSIVLKANVVSDVDNEPVVGASIIHLSSANKEKGTTLTDANGFFTLNYNEGDKVLVRYLGMKSKTVPITRHEITIALEPDDKTLGEVVVTGIYTRKAESYTGSAVTVTSQDLKRVGNANILQSLKNLDPSVYIADNLTSGSDPYSVPTVSMRGTSSFPAETSSLKSNYQHDPNSPL